MSLRLAPEVVAVRDYYDTNTVQFEKLGQGRDTGAIHRAVWGPGVSSRREAFAYLDTLVAREIEALTGQFAAPLDVLDLGCGVGASLISLSRGSSINGVGLTLSGVQAARGQDRVRHAGLGDRVAIVEGDFLDPPPRVLPAHLAYAIESFVHGPDAAAFFTSMARFVRPGGLLMIFDDFLTERGRRATSRTDLRCLDEIRHGWLANTLVTPKEANALAAAAGFTQVNDTNMTPYLELGRPRDRLIALMVALGRRLPIRGYRWKSLVGGSALQSGLSTGLIEFHAAVWRRILSL